MHLMPKNADRIATIVGTDPGTNNLGLAWINIDVINLQIHSTQAMLLTAEKLKPNKFIAEVMGDRHARLDVLQSNIVAMLHHLRPVTIVSESPFFNTMRPSAFAPLVETIEMLRRCVSLYDNTKALNFIDPPSVKRAVGASGNAKKEEVQRRVVALTELNYAGVQPLSQLDEHSIDAIAVAYSKLTEFRRNRS